MEIMKPLFRSKSFVLPCLVPLSTVPWAFRGLAFIIDHKLRKESTAEAAFASDWAERLGLVSRIIELDWGNKRETQSRKTRLLEVAREKRYHRLFEACTKSRVSTLLVGHHADDDVEGFLMRLLRGGGTYGLSGMKEISLHFHPHSTNFTLVLRPFLSLRKESILQSLRENSIPWVSDPSNADSTFYRIKIRQCLMEHKGKGTEESFNVVDDIQRLLARCKRIRQRIELQCWDIFSKAHVNSNVCPDTMTSFVDLDLDSIQTKSSILVKTLLMTIMMCLRSQHHPPTGSPNALLKAISSGSLLRKHQFGGCIFHAYKTDTQNVLRIQLQEVPKSRL